jgi:MFS family permease
MRDPSDSATERSKAFNIFYGLFFASGGLYSGYGIGILGPLGEKWLKFNFGITDNTALLFGMANLGYAIGAMLGSFVSGPLCERYGRVKLLFLSEIMMVVVHSLMWVNNIWLFLA